MPMQVHRNAAVKKPKVTRAETPAVKTIKLNPAIWRIASTAPDRVRILDENTIVVWNSPEHAQLMRKVQVV